MAVLILVQVECFARPRKWYDGGAEKNIFNHNGNIQKIQEPGFVTNTNFESVLGHPERLQKLSGLFQVIQEFEKKQVSPVADWEYLRYKRQIPGMNVGQIAGDALGRAAEVGQQMGSMGSQIVGEMGGMASQLPGQMGDMATKMAGQMGGLGNGGPTASDGGIMNRMMNAGKQLAGQAITMGKGLGQAAGLGGQTAEEGGGGVFARMASKMMNLGQKMMEAGKQMAQKAAEMASTVMGHMQNAGRTIATHMSTALGHITGAGSDMSQHVASAGGHIMGAGSEMATQMSNVARKAADAVSSAATQAATKIATSVGSGVVKGGLAVMMGE